MTSGRHLHATARLGTWLLAQVFMILASQLQAQPAVIIDSTVRCGSCRIEVGAPVRLHGVLSDGSVPNRAFVVQRADDLRSYVAYEGEFSTLYVHNPDGSFSGRRIGRQGSGPGEFQSIKSARIAGNMIQIYDRVLGRRTDVDRRTLEVIRSVRLPNHTESVVLANGQVVLTGAVSSRESAGLPLHIFTAQGAWQRSFGLDAPVRQLALSRLLIRRAGAASPSTFWTAPINEYRIELWDTNGKRLRTLVSPRSWFKPWTEMVTRSADAPPTANLTDIAIDSNGLIWVLVSRPHEQWRLALSDERDEHGERQLHPGRPFMVTSLEVIDPAKGLLLARHPLRGDIWGFAGSNAIWGTSIDPATQLPYVELIPVTLLGAARSPDGRILPSGRSRRGSTFR